MENTRDEMVPEDHLIGEITSLVGKQLSFATLEKLLEKIMIERAYLVEFQKEGRALGGIRADGSTWGIFGEGPKTPAWVAVDVDKEVPSLESPEAPSEALDSLGTPGPVYLIGGSQKPLMYSVDVFKSLKEGEFIAITSFPLVVDGNRVKPYAAGPTPDLAKANLAAAITGLTSRRELGVINEHFQITKWVCLHCDHVTGFATKQDLTTHFTQSHGGNLSVDRYTNPSVTGVYHKLP